MISVDSHCCSLDKGRQLRQAAPEIIDSTRLQYLRNHLVQAQRSAYYAAQFANIGFTPEELRSLDDLKQLPLTDRQMLERHGENFVPDNAVISDLSHTSGTTGDPVIVPYTKRDLDRLAYNEAMAFSGAGINETDRILLTVTLDRGFIAGLAYYSGSVLLGCSAIRSGPGQPAQQWKIINTLKPTVLLGVPSFLLALARWGQANGFNSSKTSIRSLVTIGEPVQNGNMQSTELGKLLHENWGVPVYSSYGATELETAFCDCRYHCGGHVHPELMIVEIVDEQGCVLPDGTAGEVVVTPLGVEGFPLVRFRTGDISRLYSEPCACGWNTQRLGPIEGRISQRLKFKGTTLYPDMILQALQHIPGTEDSYIEVRENYKLADDITVVIGADEDSVDTASIRNTLLAHLRVTPAVILQNRNKVIEKTGKGRLRKPKRFFDYRGHN